MRHQGFHQLAVPVDQPGRLVEAGEILGHAILEGIEGLAFCWPIHNPPGSSVITARAFGYMPGDLNSFVVLAVRCGTVPRPPAAAPLPAAPWQPFPGPIASGTSARAASATDAAATFSAIPADKSPAA